MIQSEYGLTTEEFLDNTPREIALMVKRISDRKSGYKMSELENVSSFTQEQEEKIRRAKEFRRLQKK